MNHDSLYKSHFLISDPTKVLKSGEGHPLQGDPLIHLEKELDQYKFIEVDGCPTFTGSFHIFDLNYRKYCRSDLAVGSTQSGGAIGYVSYDCVQYFETKTARKLADPIGMPESVFLLADTLVAFDHLFQTIRVISHIFLPDSTPTSDTASTISTSYARATKKIDEIVALLLSETPLRMPEQARIEGPRNVAVSNVGEAGYKAFVADLKQHIVKGDIIQAVPSQRLSRETVLHPFNVYR
jgi:anthranilate synthase component 1